MKILFLFLQFLIDSVSSFHYFFFAKIFFDKNLVANFLYSLQFLLNLAFLLWSLQTSWGPSFPYFFIKVIFAKFVIIWYLFCGKFARKCLKHFLVNHVLLKLQLKFSGKFLWKTAILNILSDCYVPCQNLKGRYKGLLPSVPYSVK